MPACRYDYSDEQITFYIQTYKDFVDARLCLASLRKVFKRSRVLLVSDGDDDPRYPELAKEFHADYLAGKRLYTLENGGRMIQRMLDLFLPDPTDYLFKIDTDTRLHRRFRYLPEGRSVFGTLEWITAELKVRLDFPCVQGGCIGFTLDAAREIAASQLLLSDNLKDYRQTYADNPDIVARAEVYGLVSFDYLTRFACRQLEIPIVAFDEVCSVYRGIFAWSGEGYAVTHPHKGPHFYGRRTYYAKILPRKILKQLRSALFEGNKHRD